MDADRSTDPQRVKDAFDEASAMPTLARVPFLARLRADSPALADEVESLLGYHARADPRIDSDCGLALPPSLLGMTVGGCRIERLVGAGGMSAVYAATQDFPRRRVAVKIVRPERIGASARRRLRVEAEALARLEHPNIARVYAAGSQRLAKTDAAESPYIVMELVEGAVPLTKWADARGLGARARIELAARIADAVAHAHRAGVIHRDLKPGNIIVGADGTPRIIDFGIAAVRDSSVTAATEGAMGTLAYMSPEQARGLRVDTRSDVWAIGALLYELLAGQPPFESPEASLARHIDELLRGTPAPVVPPAQAARGADFARAIPPLADAVLRRALASDPERRYAGAAELADELRRLVAGEPLAARPDSEWDALRRMMRRHRARIAAAAAVLAAVLVALVATLVLLGRERAANERAQWSAYLASISAASAMLERGDASSAQAMLDAAPAGHRGWEWLALTRMASQSAWHVAFEPEDQVYGVDWSADGRTVVAAASRFVSAVDAETRRELWRAPVPSIRPAWRVCVLANGDAIVRLLEEEILRFDASGKVVARARNLDGTDLATDASRTRVFLTERGGVQEIDPATLATRARTAIDPPAASTLRALTVSRDASIAVAGTEGGEVIAFGLPDGRRRWTARIAGDARSIGLSGDGMRVVVAGPADLVMLELASGEPVWTVDAPQANYRHAAFSPDGTEVVASAWSESVDRIDAATGARIGSITGSYSQVWQSAVSPDGQWIASGTFGARVEFFPARASSQPLAATLDGSEVTSIAARDGRTLATTASGGLFAISRGDIVEATRIACELHANAVDILPSGVIAVGHDRGVRWMSADGSVLASTDTTSRVERIGSVDRGGTTVARCEDGTLIALDPTTGAQRWRGSGFKPGSDVAVETGVADRIWLPRGARGIATLLDTATGTEIPGLAELEYTGCGALSPDRRTIALGSVTQGAEVAIVDALSLEPLSLLPNHRGGVHAVCWSRDGTRIASASRDGTVRVWHVARGIEIMTVWRGAVADLAWDESGTLWLACADGRVRAITAPSAPPPR